MHACLPKHLSLAVLELVEEVLERVTLLILLFCGGGAVRELELSFKLGDQAVQRGARFFVVPDLVSSFYDLVSQPDTPKAELLLSRFLYFKQLCEFFLSFSKLVLNAQFYGCLELCSGVRLGPLGLCYCYLFVHCTLGCSRRCFYHFVLPRRRI